VPSTVIRSVPGNGIQAWLARADAAADRIEVPLLLFIVVTLPWEFTKTWFPTPVLEVSRVAMLVAIAVLALHALTGRLRIVRGGLLYSIALVVGVIVLSAVLTRWNNGVKDAAAVVIYALLALFTSHVLDRRERLRSFGLALVTSAVIVAAIAIGQEVGGFYVWQAEGNEVLGRRNSTFGDPNVAARFLAVALVAAMAVVAGARLGRRATIAIVVAIGLIAIAQVLTLSRIGWILAIVAIGASVPLAMASRPVRLALATFVIVFGGYLLVAPTVLHRAGTAAADAVVRTGIGEPAPGIPADPGPRAVAGTPLDGVIVRLPIDSVRKYLVRAGVAMAIDHPVLGVGVGGFQPEILSTYWEYVPRERRAAPTSLLHTDSVRVLAETGLVGFVSFIAMLAVTFQAAAAAIRARLPGRRVVGWAAGSAILLILISSQFAGRFFNEPYLWLALGVLLALGGRAVRGDRAAA
jgi:O-antigen ligase